MFYVVLGRQESCLFTQGQKIPFFGGLLGYLPSAKYLGHKILPQILVFCEMQAPCGFVHPLLVYSALKVYNIICDQSNYTAIQQGRNKQIHIYSSSVYIFTLIAVYTALQQGFCIPIHLPCSCVYSYSEELHIKHVTNL